MDARYVCAVFGHADDVDLHPGARRQLLFVGLKELDVDDVALRHGSERQDEVLVPDADLENMKTSFVDGQAVELGRGGWWLAKLKLGGQVQGGEATAIETLALRVGVKNEEVLMPGEDDLVGQLANGSWNGLAEDDREALGCVVATRSTRGKQGKA
jgi:hypothetical protein